MNTALEVAVASSFFGTIGVVLSAIISRHAARRNADAALHAAVSVDWSSYAERLQQRLDSVELRLDAAEQRNHDCEARAERSETMYRAALAYLKRVVEWATANWPGEQMPPMPAGLEREL